MKQPKTIKEFKMPNTLVQGFTDNGAHPALAGLSGTDLVTLIGCLALVDEKNPEATVNVWFADFLDMLQSSKNCSPQCLHEAMTEVTIKLDTRYFEAHNTLGICLSMDKDFVGALACFDAALKIQPNQIEANFNRVTALEMLGERLNLKPLDPKSMSAFGNETMGCAIFVREDSNNV